jgi:bifunctional DNase/RNase
MNKETRLYSLAQVGGQAVLVLEEVDGPRLLPIWIGLYEAGSIGMALTPDKKFPRPLTHDLFLSVLHELGAKLEKVAVTDLKDSTFFAELFLRRGTSETWTVDSRPSDAIALAVRENCPIYVSNTVFDACPELLKPISATEVDDFRKKLETMTPEDFFRDLKNKKDDGGGGPGAS